MNLTILGPPVTKSNHQKIIQVRGRPMVIQSAPYRKWEKSALEQLARLLPLAPATAAPVSLKAIFYRERRTGDLGNYLKALCDVIERAGLIENDRLIHSFDGSRLAWDKTNPRVEFEVMPMPDETPEFQPADLSSLARRAKRRGG